MTSCEPKSPFAKAVLGTRRGAEDTVDPVRHILVGSRADLGVAVETRRRVGWVTVTWTHWPTEGRPARVLHWKALTVDEAKTFTAFLEGETMFGGWAAGTYSVDVRDSEGAHVSASLAAVTSSQ